jgi:RimJ/RimL family protein N-acetyltransferase
MTVRIGRADDVPAVLALFDVVAAEGRWIGREAPVDHDVVTERVIRCIERDDHLCLMSERDGRIVGNLVLQPDGHGRTEVGMLFGPDARGQGLGTEILTAAVDWARNQPELFKVVLDVWPHNAAGLALYRKVGFQVEGYLHRHWRRQSGELWDVVVMGLPLAP